MDKLIKQAKLERGDFLWAKVKIRRFNPQQLAVKGEAEELDGEVIIVQAVGPYPLTHTKYPGEIKFLLPKRWQDKTGIRSIASGDLILGDRVPAYLVRKQ